ncbi:unnamed protein product, partial [Rotaria sp. Silwood2]
VLEISVVVLVVVERQQEAKRRALARRKAREQIRTRTPDPVHNRKNIDVQTELYLEELRFSFVFIQKLNLIDKKIFF